jgi:hypothetical protein
MRVQQQEIPVASPKEAAEMYQNIFLTIVGARERWSMRAHVVNKWSSVVQCIIWGMLHVNDGHRTVMVFFIPLPGKPISTDPLDPIFTAH